VKKSSVKQDSSYTGWQALVKPYTKPNLSKSVWQIINSFGGLFLSIVLMYLSLSIGYWLSLLLAFPAAGFLVRIFIIQHDCGHGAFFKSRRANHAVGIVCSLFTLVSYQYWLKGHAVHHATHAELEERGIGDVWTLTVDEYLKAAWWKRIAYRVFRHPLFLFGVAPTINFVILGRLPLSVQRSWHTGERASVWWTNLMLLGWFTAAIALFGYKTVLLIQLPITIIASAAGTWLFYVQHQFEHTYWEHSPQWEYSLAALEGSSYYKLPRVLQWFTGNIGFHHIHHLSPRIPNYNLEACHKENPLFQHAAVLTIKTSLKTAWLALWDEHRHRLVTFREALRSKRKLTQLP
jgi:omega-6 fatty acid desaturase (delta-12 desaturase)